MTTAIVNPGFVQPGDQVKFGNSTFTVKSSEADLSGAWDFYLENENGVTHKVVTDQVTFIG